MSQDFINWLQAPGWTFDPVRGRGDGPGGSFIAYAGPCPHQELVDAVPEFQPELADRAMRHHSHTGARHFR